MDSNKENTLILFKVEAGVPHAASYERFVFAYVIASSETQLLEWLIDQNDYWGEGNIQDLIKSKGDLWRCRTPKDSCSPSPKDREDGRRFLGWSILDDEVDIIAYSRSINSGIIEVLM